MTWLACALAFYGLLYIWAGWSTRREIAARKRDFAASGPGVPETHLGRRIRSLLAWSAAP